MGTFEYNLGSIFKELDMDHTNGLIDDTNASTSAFQRYFFAQVKEKLKINAVYFLRDTDGTPKIPMGNTAQSNSSMCCTLYPVICAHIISIYCMPLPDFGLCAVLP